MQWNSHFEASIKAEFSTVEFMQICENFFGFFIMPLPLPENTTRYSKSDNWKKIKINVFQIKKEKKRSFWQNSLYIYFAIYYSTKAKYKFLCTFF